MSKKKILVMTIISLVIASLVFFYWHDLNKGSKSFDSRIQIITKEIIRSKYDDQIKSMESLSEEEIKSWLDLPNNEMLSDINFILGYMNSINKNSDDAIRYFNEAILNFNKKTDLNLKIRIYYELSKAHLDKKNYIKSEEIFKEIIKNYKEGSLESKHKIIDLNIARSFEVAQIPNGNIQSIKLLEDTLKMAKNTNYEGLGEVYFTLGNSYWYVDRVIEARKLKLKGLEIVEFKGQRDRKLHISTDIGIDYLFEGKYIDAIRHLEGVYNENIVSNTDNYSNQAYIVGKLYLAYMGLEDYKKSKQYLEILETTIENIKDKVKKSNHTTNFYVLKANYETKVGNPLVSLGLLDAAYEMYKDGGANAFYHFDITLLNEYGDVYYKLENYLEALKSHKKAEISSKERGLDYLEEKNNKRIYLSYKAIGDVKNTIKYLERNSEIQTELRDKADTQYAQYIHNEFENNKKEKLILKLEESQQRLKLIFLGGSLVLLMIIIFAYIIYRRNQEISRLNKLFKNLSLTDGLTKIPNRRALDDYLDENLKVFKSHDFPISFAMLDIDYFKSYNDNYGHQDGDSILKRVASDIKNKCRNTDFFARYGGEEFCIVMTKTNREEALKTTEGIRKKIYDNNIKHEYSNVSDRITLSIGVATAYRNSNYDHSTYIKEADKALYKVKKAGKNRSLHIDDCGNNDDKN